MRRPVAATVGLVLIAAGAACSPQTSPTASGSLTTRASSSSDPQDEGDDWVFEEGEEQAVLACASEKLGYELTDEIMTAEVVADASEVDTEEEWEEQRWQRAYEQCMFELPVAAVDLSDPGWNIAYRHAYALDPDGNPVMDDPLAPWAEQ